MSVQQDRINITVPLIRGSSTLNGKQTDRQTDRWIDRYR